MGDEYTPQKHGLYHIVSHCAVLCLVTQSCLTLRPIGCSPPGLSVHGASPDKNTGVGCHALLQGIFPIQGLNLGLLHCRRIFYYQGSPRILKRVAYHFSKDLPKPGIKRGSAGRLWQLSYNGSPLSYISKTLIFNWPTDTFSGLFLANFYSLWFRRCWGNAEIGP